MFNVKNIKNNNSKATVGTVKPKKSLDFFINTEVGTYTFPKGIKVFSDVDKGWTQLFDAMEKAGSVNGLVVNLVSVKFINQKVVKTVEDKELDALLGLNEPVEEKEEKQEEEPTSPLLDGASDYEDPIGYINVMVTCPPAFEDGDRVRLPGRIELFASMGTNHYRKALSECLKWSKAVELPTAVPTIVRRNGKSNTTLKSLDFLGA